MPRTPDSQTIEADDEESAAEKWAEEWDMSSIKRPKSCQNKRVRHMSKDKTTLKELRKIIAEELGIMAAIQDEHWEHIGGGQVVRPSTDPNDEDGRIEIVARFGAASDAAYVCKMQRALRMVAGVLLEDMVSRRDTNNGGKQ